MGYYTVMYGQVKENEEETSSGDSSDSFVRRYLFCNERWKCDQNFERL